MFWKIQDSRQIKRQKIHKLNNKYNSEKANNANYSKTKHHFTTLSQEMRWAYSTTLLSSHGVADG